MGILSSVWIAQWGTIEMLPDCLFYNPASRHREVVILA